MATAINGSYTDQLYLFNTTIELWSDISALVTSSVVWDPVAVPDPASIGAQVRNGTLYPLPRAYHGATSLQGQMLMWGGRVASESGHMTNDLWSLEWPTLTWHLLSSANLAIPTPPLIKGRSTPSNAQPSPRIDMIVQANEPDQLLVGFGIDESGVMMNDLYHWTMSTSTWSIHTFAAGTVPAPRKAPIVGTFEGRIILFGGASDTQVRDTW